MYVSTKYDFGGGLKLGFDVIFWETQYLDTGLRQHRAIRPLHPVRLLEETPVSKLITLCAILAGMLAGQDPKDGAAAPKEAKFASRNELR